MTKNCLKCGNRGLALGIETLKSLLRVSLRRLDDKVLYRFCATSDCEVVYFGSDGSLFVTGDLSVGVYQKSKQSPDALVCYCFQHRVQDVVAEKAEALVNDIQAGISAGQCACELRNPQGNCCLGNVLKLLKQP